MLGVMVWDGSRFGGSDQKIGRVVKISIVVIDSSFSDIVKFDGCRVSVVRVSVLLVVYIRKWL